MASPLRTDRDDWLASVGEDVLDPEREIVDPHHHLWSNPFLADYLAPQLLADTATGHRIVQTVYMECHSSYRPDGPDHLRPVGETAFVVGQGDELVAAGGPAIAGIVGHADLRLPIDRLDEVLDAHVAAGRGRFRGIRHAGARAPEGVELAIPGRASEGLYADVDFRRGVRHLGVRGFTYDTWHYHMQNLELLDLARAVPGTTVVLDHFGTPLGVGPYAGRRDEVFAGWTGDIAAIAGCENVVAKLGGLAMPDNGFGFEDGERPPTSDELVAAHAPWYEHTLTAFGASRCMFESNFPVDRTSVSYLVLWNAFKKMAAGCSPTEQDELFAGTARRVYALEGS